MVIDPRTSLAELVLDRPERAELLDRLRLDYCCRGGRSLAAACAERGLDAGTVVELLDAAGPPADTSAGHRFDCRGASLVQLCDHIVAAHHEPLRRELPRLAERLATVVRVHGAEDARLISLARVFGALAGDLTAHLDREEELLFPACRTLEHGGAPLDREALLAELEDDHADVGETLPLLRELAGGYDPSSARCGTHRALLEGLDAFERDLHVHVHEENNVLFPRLRSRLAREENTVTGDSQDTTDKEKTPMTTDADLDVRSVPPAGRHELIFDTYGELAPGEGFVLVNDHDPKPLRYQFEAEHAGAFSWDYLEQGPEVWRVRIGRPAA